MRIDATIHIHHHDAGQQLERIESKLDKLLANQSQDQLDRKSLTESLKIFQGNTESLKSTREEVENSSP